MKIESVSNQSTAYHVSSLQSAAKTESVGTEAINKGTQDGQHATEKQPEMVHKSEADQSIIENNQKAAQQSPNEEIKKAVDQLNKKMTNSEAIFGIHEETNRVTIKIVDKTTKEVIKELPPEKTLDMIAKAWELAGLLVDEKR